MIIDLNVSGCFRLTDSSAISIANRCPNLEKLRVKNCFKLTSIGLEKVAQFCRNLQELSFSGVHLVEDSLIFALINYNGCISPLPLKWLDASSCPLLTDLFAGMVQTHFPQLSHCDLSGCRLVSSSSNKYTFTTIEFCH
jgi:hypothetical protein